MASVDSSQIPALFNNVGLRVVAETFARHPAIFPRFCEVITPEQASHKPRGDKSTTVVWGAQVQRRKDGEEIQAGTAGQGYTPRGAINLLDGRLDIDERDMESNNADTEITNAITDWARQWVENVQIECDSFVANMLLRGAITAGDTNYFDNSWKGDDDSNAGKIFDGLSLFNTAHLLKYKPGTTVSNFNGSAGALSTANLTAARVAIAATQNVDEMNRKFAQAADYIITSPNLAPAAESFLTSEFGSAALDKNTNYRKLELIDHPFFTDTDAYIVGVKGRTIRAIDSGMPQPRIDWDFKRKVWVATIEKRFGAYVREWRTIFGANLPTS